MVGAPAVAGVNFQVPQMSQSPISWSRQTRGNRMVIMLCVSRRHVLSPNLYIRLHLRSSWSYTPTGLCFRPVRTRKQAQTTLISPDADDLELSNRNDMFALPAPCQRLRSARDSFLSVSCSSCSPHYGPYGACSCSGADPRGSKGRGRYHLVRVLQPRVPVDGLHNDKPGIEET